MILDKIVKRKEFEVSVRKKKHPLASFKTKLEKSERDFKKAISTSFNLIAEIKKGSPSEGIINENFSLEKLAKTYQRNRHVKAISVLTDRIFFFMGKSCLKTVRKLTTKPLLRKDFIIDEYQIYESRFYRADAILLIARILTKKQMEKFIKIAKRYNMDCLVEIHHEKELKKVEAIINSIVSGNRMARSTRA